MKAVVVFAVGFVAGVAAAYVLLGHGRDTVTTPPRAVEPATAASGPPLAGVTPAASVAPSPDAVAAWPTPPAGDLTWPSPSAVPGDSTDELMDPKAFAPPPDLKPPELPDVSDLSRLRSRGLRLPVEGFELASLHDNFAERRGARVHEAIDLLAPRGTPVVAVDDGVAKKLFTSAAGGLTVYQYDPGETYCYYYAHLTRSGRCGNRSYSAPSSRSASSSAITSRSFARPAARLTWIKRSSSRQRQLMPNTWTSRVSRRSAA